MPDDANPLLAFSDRLADLVAGAAPSVVAVHGRGRSASSGGVAQGVRLGLLML